MDSILQQQRDRLLEIHLLLSQRPDIFVLIVDDDDNDAELARRQLEALQIPNAVAVDGREAIGFVSARKVTLVFLDWLLIGLSGLETLQALKQADPELLIIILTGLEVAGASQALKHGAVAVMAKPLTEEHLKLIFSSPE